MADNPQQSVLDSFSIHPETRLGPVHLKVSNLENQRSFYERQIGLQTHWREGAQAGMGVGGEDLLHLREIEAVHRQPGRTGLYHFAILLPEHRELARVIARLLQARYPNYPTDHIMTKTTYLDDPEGNGIELYSDSPEEGIFGIVDGVFYARRRDGSVSSGREPLDLERLFEHLQPGDRFDQPMPAGTKMGHVHLHVADLPEAFGFYHNTLGFDDMGYSPAFRAAFVSAGGYHHHIGLNTWAGEGAPPPPADAPGLDYFSVLLPNQDELEHLRSRIKNTGIELTQKDGGILIQDPSRNGVLITIENSELQNRV